MHTPAQLQTLVADAIKQLAFPVTPSRLYDPVRYMLEIGGKRMRPVLVLMGCEVFGKSPALAMNAALGVEVFHNFTLLHDDIMDQAPLRRSVPTVHAKWNQSIAILSGDVMFVKACELINDIKPDKIKPCMEIFLRAAREVCEGQQYDMDFESEQSVSIEQYLEMIRLKTAVLVGASLQIGAVIGDADTEDASHLYDFGMNLGMAFQLQDDILDAYGDAGKFGKQTGGDILANKKTFLLLTALSRAEGDTLAELNKWLRLQSSQYIPAEKVEAVKAIYDRLGVHESAVSKMDELYNHALNHLQAIPVDDAHKNPLRTLAGELMIREV
jgi:geranylgeranyl diphosphate synthase type II